MESTGSKSEEIKLLIYWENRVRAGKVPMPVIDVTQSVFSPGLVRVFCRWGMVLEDLEDTFSSTQIHYKIRVLWSKYYVL